MKGGLVLLSGGATVIFFAWLWSENDSSNLGPNIGAGILLMSGMLGVLTGLIIVASLKGKRRK